MIGQPLVCLVFFLIFVLCQLAKSRRYDIELEKIEEMPGENGCTFDGFRVKKYNRSIYVFDGNLSTNIEFGNDVDTTIVFYNFAGGQYKKIIDKTFKQLCTTMYSNEEVRPKYEHFRNFSNIGPWGTCPFLIGKYFVKNYLVEDPGLLPEYIPGGPKWKIETRFSKDGVLVSGYDMYVSITPIATKLG